MPVDMRRHLTTQNRNFALYLKGLSVADRCMYIDADGLAGGGRGGIRTHGTLAGTPVFKTGALNHSATLPNPEWLSLNVVDGAWQREVGALPKNPTCQAASVCSH